MQLDQLSLFPEPPTADPPRVFTPARVASYPYREFDDAVARREILDLLAGASGDWVSCFEIFGSVRIRPQDLACVTLFDLVELGQVEERHCYYGASEPGKPGYNGYYSAYRMPAAEVPS